MFNLLIGEWKRLQGQREATDLIHEIMVQLKKVQPYNRWASLASHGASMKSRNHSYLAYMLFMKEKRLAILNVITENTFMLGKKQKIGISTQLGKQMYLP